MSSKGKLSVLILGGLLLSGCESSYHPFDGKSGFSFKALGEGKHSTDEYIVEYYGDDKSSQRDVETMWHHAARELCRGGSYQHHIVSRTEESKQLLKLNGGNLIPPSVNTFQVKGEILCLAPNLAKKSISDDRVLLGKHLSSDHFESGSATN